MNSSPPDQEDTRKRRRWEWLLLLLALLASFACVCSATYMALWIQPNQVVKADMLAQNGADYGGGPGESTQFAPVNADIITDATADARGLQLTPVTDAGEPDDEGVPIAVIPGPALPTATAMLPRAQEASPVPTTSPTTSRTTTATVTDSPTATSTAEATTTSTATRRPPTQAPAATLMPSVTATETSTPVPPPPTNTPVPPPPPTDTPVPPPPPTDTPVPPPPPTNTPVPPPPTNTPVPPPTTSTPTSTPTPTGTPTLAVTPANTSIPTSTATPTNTPTPSPTITLLGVQPITECVSDNGDGTFTAYFGYLNQNASAVNVPVGPENRFNPAPQDRGQPTTFQPGRVVAAFSVVANNNNTLTWTLQGSVTSAGSADPPCATPTPTSTPTATTASLSVDYLRLINADTDQPISAYDPLTDGVTLNLATLPTRNLNIEAITIPSPVGSVVFELDGSPYPPENFVPYALASDVGGDYFPWTPSVGNHVLRITPYTGLDATGSPGTTLTFNFSVIDQ